MALFDYEYWRGQIKLSKDFIKGFQEKGQVVDQRYRDEEERERLGAKKFNMFWANVGILMSALYGNPPRPVVQREFQDPMDDVARVAATIIQRLLQTGPGGTATDMHNAFIHSVQDRLIPGLGQVWLRYDAKITQVVPMEGMSPVPQLQDENVATDYVHWCDFFWEPCRVWEECGWAARRVWMTKERFERRFPDYKGEVTYKIHKDNVAYEATMSASTPGNESQRRAEVFEIWCKTSNHVYWIADGATEILDKQPPLVRLSRFYPCPKPLAANLTTAKFLPKADYTMVQDQYTQLDDLNQRISLLIDACKVVGVYNKQSDGVQRMLNQGVENQLIPVDNWAMFAESGGIKGSADWLPIEQVAMVLDKLKEQRVDVVQQIYELTGLSDIMRGVTEPRETLGAQKLKAQYSSSRLQLYQGSVATFVAEAMQIKAEIIANNWQPQTILNKSLIMMTADAQLAQQAVALIKQGFHYRINISATQMSIPDYNAEKEERVSYMTAAGQFFSQITPLLQQVPQAAPFFLKMLQWAGTTFQKAGEMESILDEYVRQVEKKLQEPPPPPSPMQQAELDKIKSEAAENYATAEEKRAKAQAPQVNAQAQMMKTQGDLAVQQAQTQGDQARAAAEVAATNAKTEAQIRQGEAKLMFDMMKPEKPDGEA